MICSKCSCYYEPLKNGVNVFGKFGGALVAYWRADIWQCPVCNHKVVTQFGKKLENSPVTIKGLHEGAVERGEEIVYVNHDDGNWVVKLGLIEGKMVDTTEKAKLARLLTPPLRLV